MTQGKLFSKEDLPPIARKKDPPSSKAAARAITDSGKREEQVMEVFSVVVEYPGRTSLELTEFTWLDRYQIARRLPELEKRKMIRKGAIRQCSRGHRPAVTWWPDGK